MTTIEGADWTTYERGCVREQMLRVTRLLDTVLVLGARGGRSTAVTIPRTGLFHQPCPTAKAAHQLLRRRC
jgi:hypothetical protein